MRPNSRNAGSQSEMTRDRSDLTSESVSKHLEIENESDMGRFGLMSSCASPRCAGRLQLALGASQIIDDRGDIFRSYRRLVRADHLVDDLLPSLLRQIGLIQNVIGGMAGEAVAVERVGSWPVREGRIARRDLEIERCQRVELRRMADERQQHDGHCRSNRQEDAAHWWILLRLQPPGSIRSYCACSPQDSKPGAPAASRRWCSCSGSSASARRATAR